MQPVMNSTVMNTYGRLPVSFVRGEGAYVYDTENRRYLDALAGIAVCGLGHAHPAVTEAVSQQAGQLIHTSNLYGIQNQQDLAERLTALSGMDNVFFSNSGAEANEAMIKIARKYGHNKGIAEPVIIVMTKAFHGRTMATLTATGNPAAQAGFGPMLNGFVRVPYMDTAAIDAVVAANSNVVAVMLEPIQGEGGLATASTEYMQAVRKICDDNELLMLVDEIQTGNGRTGTYFNCEQHGVTPDVMTTAKGLGNGVPIGACMARGAAAEVLQPGSHGSTYGGNPLACAAGIAVVDTIKADNLCEYAKAMGEYLTQAFTEKLINTGKATEIRGNGLMMGIVMTKDCPQLMAKAVEKSLLLNVTAGNVIRLLPPLNITQAQADDIVEIVCELVAEL